MNRHSDKRSQGRSNVYLSATLLSGSGQEPVRVRNLSARGALLEGETLPSTGTKVRLLRGELSAEGQIVRQAVGQVGIRFSGEIDVTRWVKRVEHPGQRQVDTIIAAMRAGKSASSTAPHAEAPMLQQISEELDRICARLAASAPMSVELGEELVKLEALARRVERTSSRS